MSDEPKKEESGFQMTFDHATNPDHMYLQIPLNDVAGDRSINGIIFLLGFLENAKNEAVAIIRAKRKAAQQGKILTPGNAPSSILAVH